MTRPRSAPSARRIPSSGARATPRASSIPAALKHAMSRTSPTSANSRPTKRLTIERPSTGTVPAGLDADAMATVVVGELALQVAADAREVGAGLLEAHPRLQAPDAHQPLPPALRDPPEVVAVRVGGDRDPQALILEAVAGEGRVRDAHDRERAPVQPHRAADDVRRAVELRLPEPMADHDDGAGTLESLVGWREGASARHRHAEHVEVVGRDVRARHRHGFVARAEPELRQPADVVGRQSLEHRLPRAVVEIVRIGEGVEPAILDGCGSSSAVCATDFGQAVRVGDA